MPNNVGFFTAIEYGQKAKTRTQSILEKVDNYFYFSGKKAQVIQGKTKNGTVRTILLRGNSSLLARVGKVASYFTIVIPLLMLIAKAILRSTHHFRLINPKKKLEKGINISEHTISKIQHLMPKILFRKDDNEIEWLSTSNNLVFKLRESPQLVFKITCSAWGVDGKGKLPIMFDGQMDRRFKNMIKAKEVCLARELGLLVIPQAKKFTVNVQDNKYVFIAEESLDVNADESSQEHLYYTYSKELNETIRQLAIFIAKTGFNDISWRNIPLLNEAADYDGPRRVGLIDVEYMKNVVDGFKGDNRSRGLIKCATTESQIDAIIDEAYKQSGALTSEEAQTLKNQRLDELEFENKLRHFYEQNGIKTGREPIQVDINSLGLDLTEEGQATFLTVKKGKIKSKEQTLTLKKAVEDVISQINKLIQDTPEQASLRGKRYVFLNTSHPPLQQYNLLRLPTEKFTLNKEDVKKIWVRQIIQALLEKGHLFKLVIVNSQQFFIQA